MAGKYNFILKHEHKELFDDLSNDDAGRLIKAIYAYEVTGELPPFERGELRAYFNIVKGGLDVNRAKYEVQCERNRKNGEQGGRPPN